MDNYCDTETGWYYLNSRYYDPQVRRFINADAYLGTDQGARYNLFSYCGNNPVMYNDPTGSIAVIDDILVALGVGVICLFTIVIISVFTSNFPVYGTGALQPNYGRDNILDLDKFRKRPPTPFIPPSFGSDIIPPSVPDTATKNEKPTYEEGMYYGVDLTGKTWNVKTGPMTESQARDWVYTAHLAGMYGKGSSWGVYTPHHDDAWKFAYKQIPLIHENHKGQYDHFHINNYSPLFGIYKHFHVWFGSIR